LSINDPWARPPAVAQPCDSTNLKTNSESDQNVIIGSSAEVLLEGKPFESVHSVANDAAGSHLLVGEGPFFASGAAARPASAGQVLAIMGSAAEVAAFARTMGFGALAPSFSAQLPIPCGPNFSDLPSSHSGSDISSHYTSGYPCSVQSVCGAQFGIEAGFEASRLESATFLKVGDSVVVRQDFVSDSEAPVSLLAGSGGRVVEIDSEGDAEILFAGLRRDWVFHSKFVNLAILRQRGKFEEDRKCNLAILRKVGELEGPHELGGEIVDKECDKDCE
jgi:hypothetical protein